MKHNFTKIAAAVVLASAGSVAMAENFYNDVGAAGGTGSALDADTYTGLLSQWSLFADTTTTQYDSDASGGINVGDAFNDAGDAYMIGGLFAPGGSPSTAGFDVEGIGDGNHGQLTAHWTNIAGTIESLTGDATGANVSQAYSGGTIDFYYNNSVTFDFGSGVGFKPQNDAALGTDNNSGFTDGTLVLSIDLIGGTGASRFDLLGNYVTGSFDLDFEVTTALDDFWYFADGTDFNDLVSQLLRINTNIDANTDNVVQTACPDSSCLFTVDSDHDGSIVFDRAVPVPGTLALFGLGLLGLGGMARRNKKLAS